MDDGQRAAKMVLGAEGKRLTYKQPASQLARFFREDWVRQWREAARPARRLTRAMRLRRRLKAKRQLQLPFNQ